MKRRQAAISKSDLFVKLAEIPETDPRLEKLAALLSGKPEPMNAANLRLLPMGQAAERLNVHRSTLWRLCREGRIKTTELRRGTKWVAENELRRFVEGVT